MHLALNSAAVGVVAGIALKWVADLLTDHLRFARERRIRFDSIKLDVYARLVAAMDRLAGLVARADKGADVESEAAELVTEIHAMHGQVRMLAPMDVIRQIAQDVDMNDSKDITRAARAVEEHARRDLLIPREWGRFSRKRP